MYQTLRSPNRLLLMALVLGVGADLLFFNRAIGISAAIFVIAGLLALGWLSHAEARPPTVANLWLGGAALLFALLLAVRETPSLSVLNACAAAGLLLLLAATYRGHSLAALAWFQAMAHSLIALVEIAFYPAPLFFQGARSMISRSDQVRRLAPVARGLLIATPTVLIFTALLASADSVFSSYIGAIMTLQLPFDLSAALNHTLFAGCIGWLCAGGLLVALREGALGAVESELPAEGATQRLPALHARPLGFVEAFTVLVSVSLLFGAFMLIQGAYFFGGRDTLDQTGMTFSEYARRGFFELLAVAILALAMLLSLAGLTRRESRTQLLSFNAGCTVIVALVIGLLISAFQRMMLYQAEYGFTHLRIYTLSFMVWLALVLALFLAALFRAAPRLFSWGTFGTALVYLLLLNLANPDALIARENLARYQQSGRLDAWYLRSLSADATPDLAAALPALHGDERMLIESGLTEQWQRLAELDAASGWQGWHLARWNAHLALTDLARAAGSDAMPGVDLREVDPSAAIDHSASERILSEEERRIEVNERKAALTGGETGRHTHRQR